MANNPRVVFDTRVVVSAFLLHHSVPRQALDRVAAGGKWLCSTATILELHSVLIRKKFDRWVSSAKRLKLLAAYVRESEIIRNLPTIAACRDPKDDKFLELAVGGGATHLISGDQDLLALHPFSSVAILTPRDFLDAIAP